MGSHGKKKPPKNFTLMVLIQALIRFYNIHPHLDLLRKKTLLMAYI
jgi:hypothetical protein